MHIKTRLSEEEIKQLRERLPQPAVGQDTTAHQAGYLLGIQHVLRLLEDGWVVKR